MTSQLQNQYLVHCNGEPYFKLKPELEFTWDNKQENTKQENKRVILDTKWKMLDTAKSSGKDKFGLSQQDFYQMLGYGHKYINGSGEMVLIYPKK